MADRPILFSAPMVRALLEGRKTQTRRVLKPQPPAWCSEDRGPGYSVLTPPGHIEFRGTAPIDGYGAKFIKLPYARGDKLWVREAWRTPENFDRSPATMVASCLEAGYARPWAPIQWEADGSRENWGDWRDRAVGRLRQSMHLPRAYSRLTLVVTDVRVQRLNAITTNDAVAEGALVPPFTDQFADVHAVEMFRCLWDGLNAERGFGWAANPWVVAVRFSVIRRNINQMQ